ncbi:HWE histidine kinase domain-containing protein [Sphingomonas sp. M1-B02]|uniref:HWE histidine kinase domain-containing protein n=1 Tax=Sphingomonas sp. M1-B02 TaxID=3114300 RepID=UPI0022400975|nr:HWE histidine kinase domain-containing protein [Sphingomonas sp. S6-11]UZK67803.1 PAS domain-containing protein [Sphingomonas sp. S6-11]
MEQRKSQELSLSEIDAFRDQLGPFVVAAEKTRMPMIFTEVNHDHKILFANDAFLTLTGYRRDQALGKSFHSLLALESRTKTRSLVEAAFRGECDSDPEIHYRRENGSEFWASMFVSPVCDGQGHPIQNFVSLIDLTTHRRMIDELNHRVKNTLSTVQSIISQAVRDLPEADAVRASIESRVLALSRSHDLLTSQNWEGAGLHELIRGALHPFEAVAGHAERFLIRGENLHLQPKMALALTIALHELATNAIKYGAFSNNAGRVEISWVLVLDANGDRLVLCWQEQGGPPVIAPTHKGFGSWVLERGLAHELGGTVALEFLEQGLMCTIDIPAPVEMDV